LSAATARINAFEPAFQLSDCQTLISQFGIDQSQIATALTNLQTNGISPYLSSSATRMRMMAASIAPPDPTMLGRSVRPPRIGAKGGIQTATYYPSVGKPHFRPTQVRAQRPFLALPSEGGSYTCAKDAVMQMGFNTEALIIGFACWGGWLTGFICTPILAVVSLGWAAAHTVICGWG
jgi:hypothetical protein